MAVITAHWSTLTLGFAVSGVSCHGEATLGHMRYHKQKLMAMSKWKVLGCWENALVIQETNKQTNQGEPLCPVVPDTFAGTQGNLRMCLGIKSRRWDTLRA